MYGIHCTITSPHAFLFCNSFQHYYNLKLWNFKAEIAYECFRQKNKPAHGRFIVCLPALSTFLSFVFQIIHMRPMPIIVIHFISSITKILKIYNPVFKIRMWDNAGIHHCNRNILPAKS
nr:MAG TPA: hypothetical protein [Bacteriophage sp.]